jgi:hypothetical protein
MTTATREDIVWWWIGIDDHLEALKYNWQTHDPVTMAGMWNVTDDTYINGVPMILDGDYHMGHLLEVAERESGVVSYVAIATYHGKCSECGYQAHDSMWFPTPVGTFFEREVDLTEACRWAVGVIHGMWENADQTAADMQHHERGCPRGPEGEDVDDEPATAEAT